MNKIYNGVIKSVYLTNEDYGILTAFITIEHERGVQSFGGYQLYCPKYSYIDRTGWFIWRVLETVLDDKGWRWGNLVGKSVRVKIDANGYGIIQALGHFIEDRWFNPKEELAKFVAEREKNDSF